MNTRKKTALTKIIDAHDARVHFGQLLDEVDKKDYTYFVKRRGKLTAVILSPEDYMEILEIGAELSDPEINKTLVQSKKEFEIGEVGTEEDIFKILRSQQDGQNL
ncbi:MAG: type II toxin-antitoxin system Phd/YefM family antitoxin [Actinobacteria bacterium]|nr:type II toxin-antitoxin system Phd/YefM family antitoxin [Actinomycetota bacterium]